jgi:hypothetical protein
MSSTPIVVGLGGNALLRSGQPTDADTQRRNVTGALCDEISVVIADHRQPGSGVAELWCASALLGILHEESGGIVLRLESHARGPLPVSAAALERALAEARERLTVAVDADSDIARAEGAE